MADLIHIKGLDQLGKFLRTYPEKVAKHAMLKPNAIAAKTIASIAKGLAQEWKGDVQKGHPPPGTLKRSIQIKLAPGPWWRIQYIVFVRHGPKYQKWGKKQENFDAYYWWWQEFGWHDRKGVFHKHPFLRPAFESTKEPTLVVLLEDLNIAALDLAAKEGWGKEHRSAPVFNTPFDRGSGLGPVVLEHNTL